MHITSSARMVFKTVLCIIVLHCVPAAALCPNSWVRFQDSCYLFSHEASTFTEAEHYCERHSGHLVHVNSATETAFLKTVLVEQKHERHWIGLTDRDMETLWSWVDNQQAATYTDWHAGEPNQGSVANCAAVRSDYSYQWTDDWCQESYPAICEKRTDDVLAVVGPVG